MPFTGSASVEISRIGSNVDVHWDNVLLVSGSDTSLLSRIDIEFQFFPYPGSFFGSESVDLVSVTDATSVPEPTTIALLGIGIAGIAGVEVRRRRKKAVTKS